MRLVRARSTASSLAASPHTAIARVPVAAFMTAATPLVARPCRPGAGHQPTGRTRPWIAGSPSGRPWTRPVEDVNPECLTPAYVAPRAWLGGPVGAGVVGRGHLGGPAGGGSVRVSVSGLSGPLSQPAVVIVGLWVQCSQRCWSWSWWWCWWQSRARFVRLVGPPLALWMTWWPWHRAGRWWQLVTAGLAQQQGRPGLPERPWRRARREPGCPSACRSRSDRRTRPPRCTGRPSRSSGGSCSGRCCRS